MQENDFILFIKDLGLRQIHQVAENQPHAERKARPYIGAMGAGVEESNSLFSFHSEYLQLFDEGIHFPLW